eukprot:Mrub_05321.p1 GENE.Mrub_05321~~Mrub_05321.p1  ORF type:complete len:167 (-),score=11.67 Mrub_05321:387-887(-)
MPYTSDIYESNLILKKESQPYPYTVGRQDRVSLKREECILDYNAKNESSRTNLKHLSKSSFTPLITTNSDFLELLMKIDDLDFEPTNCIMQKVKEKKYVLQKKFIKKTFFKNSNLETKDSLHGSLICTLTACLVYNNNQIKMKIESKLIYLINSINFIKLIMKYTN